MSFGVFVFALICVDVPVLDGLFHYAVPDDMLGFVKIGMRVKVPFGKRDKPINGYILGLTDKTDSIDIPLEKIKPIASTMEDYPLFSAEMLELAGWMRDKYYTTLSSCLGAILPPGLAVRSKPWGSAPDPAGRLCASGTRLAGELANWESPDPVFKGSLEIFSDSFTLNGDQAFAVDYILDKITVKDHQPILIHGVTGSGKTEVYLRAIAQVMEMGKQAIVLVPEIALTPQTVAVFKKRFGDAAAVTHSRMTAKERFIQWQRARMGLVSVMIGPRSAIFAPFDRLGIIIIDEEHEHTYRSESTPKFDAREVAIKRAEYCGALVVMGSATPSLETYYRTDPDYKAEPDYQADPDYQVDPTNPNKKYALLKMPERINGMFPEVHVTDMRREIISGNTGIFSRAFCEAALGTLERGQQIILFLNRRGHSSFISCRNCGHVMGCDSCRVNFTYHKSTDRLICHYCGKNLNPPTECPACRSPFIKYFGLGTQKIEEEVARLFPGATALRMDMDTTKTKKGHSKILSAFKKNEAQILIGTQMIAKGLDFPNVTLVGIVAADLSLFTGDFRAAEHTFGLLTQVSGRAGRAKDMGRVFIQTYNPDHYSIKLAQKADYETFYEHEMSLRRTMGYPPFSHVFMVLFTGEDERAVIKALHKLLAIMKYCNKKEMFEMLGPAPAFVSKVKKQFRWKLLVKCNQEEILKQFVIYCVGKLKDNDPLKGILVNLTLDPISME